MLSSFRSDIIMTDRGLIYMVKRIGPRTEPCGHPSVLEQKQNNE